MQCNTFISLNCCFFVTIAQKTMDVSKICLEQLLKFLDSKQDESIISSLQLTISSESSLEVLKVLSDACNFREEIKKPKKKKLPKNAPPEEEVVILEDPMYESLRRYALKCVYCIIRTLHGQPKKLKDLQKATALVPDLLQNMCQVITMIKNNITNENSDIRAKATQDIIYALMILVFLLRHNPEAIVQFTKTDLLASLRDLSKEKKLTMYCIQLLELLSTTKEGLVVLNSTDNQTLLSDLLSRAAEELHHAATEEANTAAPNAKDKGKKEAPKKGALEVVEDPMDKLDWIAVPVHRSALVAIKLICKIYITIGSQLNAVIDLEVVKHVATIVSKTILSPTAYEVARSSLQAPLDEPLHDCVDAMSIAIGTLGALSGEVRQVTYQAGALSSVLTVLLNSRTIVAGPPPTAAPAGGKQATPVVEAPALTPEKQAEQDLRLVQLRRVAEKTVLNLVTESLESPLDDTEAGHVSHGIHLPVRWTSCFARKSDDEAFDAADASLAAKLVDLLSVSNDDDLTNRGVRVLASILHGHHHPVELIESKGLHKTLIAPLAKIVQLRGSTLLTTEMESDIRLACAAVAEAAAQTAAAAEAAALPEEEKVDEVTEGIKSVTLEDSNIAGAGEVDIQHVTEDSAIEVANADVLIPSVAETFFLALSIVELFLMATPETVNAFANTERIEVLSNLIRALGPVSHSAVVGGVSEKLNEFEAVLHDPRRHNWSSLNPSSYCDNVLVRPLIFDVLALIASAGQKYRTYEGALPAPPCEPVPPSQSPCEEAALITCKGTADACCAVLLSQSQFRWTSSPSGVHLNLQPCNSTRSLVQPVQDAALSLLRAIASCGARGVAGALTAIATSGFRFITTGMQGIDVSNVDNVDFTEALKRLLQMRCAMKDLALFINQTVHTETVEVNLSTLLPAGYAWKCPTFFDEVFPVNDVLTMQNYLPENRQIWPLVVFCGAFIGTLSSPATAQSSAALTLEALSAAVRLPVLEDHSQSVVTDAISAVFLSMGGGVAISGLLGRFGNIHTDTKPAGEQLAYFLFNRGHSREVFWADWEATHREEVILDPKTGKPIPKKDDKKTKDPKAEKKKDPKAPADVPSAIPDMELNFESTGEFPDPNHGPSRELWVKLLDVFADDLHEICPVSSSLISSVQGLQMDMAVFLINQGAAVNYSDGTNHTALMYALLLNEEAVVEALMTKNADFDLIDKERNPTVKYAILSLGCADIDSVLAGHNHQTADEGAASIEVFGRPTLLHTLLNSSMDFNVAGPRGLSPIMLALGLGDLTVMIGGYRLHIVNASYNSPDASLEQVYLDVEGLIKDGADVNFCNVDGLVPLHIAAARGDVKLMESLLNHGAEANAVDYAGYLPLHYLAACCPEAAIESFDILLKATSYRHLQRTEFYDFRTGVAPEEKNRIELERYMTQAFKEAKSPSVISKKRLNPAEILHVCTDANMNILKLCFSAPVLYEDDRILKQFIQKDKTRRMDLALHIIQTTEKIHQTANDLLTHTDEVTNFTTLHAASLLFQGMTPQIFLTEREKRAKRVRKFISNEARLLDYFYQCVDSAVFNATCSIPVKDFKLEKWTLMHPAVYWDNAELASCLLEKGFHMENTEMIHFMAQYCPTASEALVKVLMEAATGSAQSKALLNETASSTETTARPLHLAVRTCNLHLVRALAACVKVDLNAVDEVSKKTALHEACESGDLDLVHAFLPGADRLDLFAGSNNAAEAGSLRTPLNVALEGMHINIVQELIHMRKNDVIQQLLQISSNTSAPSQSVSPEDPLPEDTAATAATLLYALEKQNAELAKKLGLDLPPLQQPPVTAAGASQKEKETLDENALSGSKHGSEKPLRQISETLSDADETADKQLGEEEEENIETTRQESDQVEPMESSEEVISTVIEAPFEDLDVIEQSATGGKALKDKKRNSISFYKSNEVLRVLIDLVNSSGIVGEGDHFHPYYYQGELIDK